MKRVKRLTALIAVAFSTLSAGTAMAATDGEIQTAIDNGLGYLSGTQTMGGYWNYGGYEQAATGSAAYAMMTQQGHWGDLAAGNVAAYKAQVDNAIAYLLSTATTTTVSTRNDGANICPGGGSCTGVYWYGAGETTYTTGLIAPAIAEYATRFGGGAGAVATTTGPLAGMTWGQIAQGITNTFSAGQSSAINGNRDGGWRYFPGTGDSDSSTTQWAVISLIYNQTLGATTPQSVKDHLAVWLANAQAADGSACYQPGVGPCDQADTGGLLVALNFLGKGSSDPAVQKALNYLNNHWQEGQLGWNGNFGQPYAMWAEYKGLELTVGLGNNTAITNLLPGNCGNDRGADCNWWQDYNQWLVANQAGDGSFPGYYYWGNPLATSLVLPILSGTEIPQQTPEPGSLALLLAALAGSAAFARRRA